MIFGQPAVAQPKRILIVLLSEMGSLVLAQPMFADLRKRYPDASLHILMFAKNREVLDLLGVMPPENVITIRDKSLGGFVADTLARDPGHAAYRLRCRDRLRAVLAGERYFLLFVGRHDPRGISAAYAGRAVPRLLYQPSGAVQPLPPFVAAVPDHGRRHRVGEPSHGQGTARANCPRRRCCSLPRVKWQQIETRSCMTTFPCCKDKKLVLVYPDGGILPIRAWPAENYKQLCDRAVERRLCGGADRPARRQAAGAGESWRTATSECAST